MMAIGKKIIGGYAVELVILVIVTATAFYSLNKQASTQNVASTKQAEIAAQGLHELGQKLDQLVG